MMLKYMTTNPSPSRWTCGSVKNYLLKGTVERTVLIIYFHPVIQVIWAFKNGH